MVNYENMDNAKKALKKIKENSSVIKEMNESKKTKFEYQLPEFDQDFFEEKIELDFFYYNVLLENLQDIYKDDVSSLIIEMLNDVRDIHNFVNVEPKIVGFGDIDMGESSDTKKKKAKTFVSEFLNKKYYNLTEEQRAIKYKDIIINESFETINSSSNENNIDNIMETAYKSLIISDLIESINFPFVIHHHIQNVIQDSMYRDFFDIDYLQQLVESFNFKNKQLSKIISLII